MKPTLYIMVGLPGSGKSTFILNHLPNAYLISRDSNRMSRLKPGELYFAHEKEVFREYVYSINYALCLGRNVVADATHLNEASRFKLINALKTLCNLTTDQYDIIFVCMNVDVETCIARDTMREGRAYVGREVIENIALNLSFPTQDEFPNVKGIWMNYE